MNTNTLKTSMAACGILAIFAGLALAQEQSGTTAKAQPNVRYAVTDLGDVGPDGQPFQVTNDAFVAGAAMVGNALHGVLWYEGHMVDLGTPGLKGQNSQAGRNLEAAPLRFPRRHGEYGARRPHVPQSLHRGQHDAPVSRYRVPQDVCDPHTRGWERPE